MPKSHNPLPQLIPARINRLRQILGGAFWSDRQDLPVLGGPINEAPLPVSEAPAQVFQPVKPGEFFGAPSGDWQQRWFRLEIPAPQAGQAGRRYFFWDCRGETTAYLDGNPWAGLDVAHPYCILPDRACTLWLDCGTYQTGVWATGKPPDQYGLRFEGAWIACRNPLAWETYWDLEVLGSLMESMLKDDGLTDTLRMWGPFPEIVNTHPVLRKLLYQLDEAYKAWEIGGTPALAPILKQIYREFPAESWQPQVTLVGHSHLDLVWLWPEIEGERKGVHTFSTALRLLEEYPEFTFMWTSPANYKALERRAPGLHTAIREQIHRGRWEATGASWLEFDTLIACGEALGRSLALGQRYFEKLRGSISSTLWVPDCFGYNVALPQLLKLAGVHNFYTSKMSWSAITNFPYHSFVWRSPDGSEVLTHLTVIGDPESPAGLAHMARSYRQGDVHAEMLTGLGVGDGGGGTTVASIERVRRLGNLSQVPRTAWGFVEPFFERLEGQRPQLPVFEGELYLEFHRGIYTTHSEFKRLYRGLERALQVLEAVRAVTGGGPVDEHFWERLCFCQFHDAIPGSSIQLVYNQLQPELEALSDQALHQASTELGAFLQPTNSCAGLAVFNPLLLPRRAVIELPTCSEVTLDNGQKVSCQPVADGVLASISLDGFGLRCLEINDCDPVDPGSATPDPMTAAESWQVSSLLLDNGLLHVEFDTQGQITTVRDPISDWPLAESPAFVLYPDNPAYFDAWEVDHGALRQGGIATGKMELEVIESGPVRAILRGSTTLGEHSRLTVAYILEAGSYVLRIEASVDWREAHRLLKYHLPTQRRGRMARYGAPFGSVERPQTPAFPHEEAMWEVPASRWAAVTDDAGWDGLAILSEAKYGFSCRDGNLALSLLRAADDPVLGDPSQPQRLAPHHATDQGEHRLRFALARFRAATLGDQLSTAAQAEALYAPFVVAAVNGRYEWTVPVRVESDLVSLVPSWVLPSRQGQGIILRLHETMDVPGTVKLAFTKAPQSVQPVDLLERYVQGVIVNQLDDVHYEVKVSPYQVVSLKVS